MTYNTRYMIYEGGRRGACRPEVQPPPRLLEVQPGRRAYHTLDMHMCISVSLSLYIYIYVHVYVHTCIYIYIYIH